jgi:tetratricopeptide (TPR) repeat protein
MNVTADDLSMLTGGRHLFRHLNDARRLRHNPIVAHYFGHTRDDERDAAAISTVRMLIFDAVRMILARDAATVSARSIRRRLTIVERLCSGSESPAIVAAQLHISLRQYYRELRTLYADVARYIASVRRSARSESVLDFDNALILRRGRALLESGYAASSYAEFEQIASSTGNEQVRIYALSELVHAALWLGDTPRATSALGTAQARLTSLGSADETVRRSVSLAECACAQQLGRYDEASRILRDLYGQISRCVVVGDDALAVAISIAVKTAEDYDGQGRFGEARGALSWARAATVRLQRVPPELSVATAILEAEVNEDGAESVAAQIQRLDAALKLCLSFGSATGALWTTSRLMRCYSFLRRDQDAKFWMDRMLSIGHRMDGTLGIQYATLSAGDALLDTPIWRILQPLLFREDLRIAPGTTEWTCLRTLQGCMLLRLEHIEEAAAALTDAVASADRVGNGRLLAVALRYMAQAHWALGRRRDAYDSIHRAVDLAEQNASIRGLHRAYAAAADLLHDERYRLLARQTSLRAER